MKLFGYRNVLNDNYNFLEGVYGDGLQDNSLKTTLCVTYASGDNYKYFGKYLYKLIGGGTSFFASPHDYISNITVFPISTTDNDEGDLGYIRAGFSDKSLDCRVRSPRRYVHLYRLCVYKYLGAYGVDDFRSYNQYCKVKIYLPYYGVIDMNPNDVVGKYINIFLTFTIDNPKGLYIIATSNTPYDNIPVGNVDLIGLEAIDDMDLIPLNFIEFNLGTNIPIGSTNYDDMIRNTSTSVASFIASMAFAGAPIPQSTSTTIPTTNTTTTTYHERNPKTNRMIKSASVTTKTEYGGGTRTYNNEEYERSRRTNDCFKAGINALGSFSADVSIGAPSNSSLMCNMGLDVAIITYKTKTVGGGDKYNHLYGQPYGMVNRIGNMRGYTIISDVHIEHETLNNITNSERAMLEDALINGIIL